jgi:hypothetical protein
MRKDAPVMITPATITNRASTRSSSHPISGALRPADSGSAAPWSVETCVRDHPKCFSRCGKNKPPVL